MNDKTQITDQDLEEYLNDKSELSEIYTESKDLKAPEHLAFAVKRMAREAESKQPSSNKPVVRKNVWFVPLSIAATVVIAITLVFVVDFQKVDETNHIAIKENDTAPQTIPLQQEAVTPPQQTASVENTIALQPETHTTEIQKQETTPDIKTEMTQQTDTRLPRESVSEQPAPTQQSPAQKTLQVADEATDFELPPHLIDMMQSTSAGSQDVLLPAEVLKTWTREQWKQQVQTLIKTDKEQLANQYIEQYPTYYPGETLTVTP